MAVHNSINSVLDGLTKLTNNNVGSYESIYEAVTSSKDSVTLTIDQTDGSQKVYIIPSFKSLKRNIDRIDRTLSTIMNIDNGDGSNIRLSDGSLRRLALARVPFVPVNSSYAQTIINFQIKDNYFFESLMCPQIHVKYKVNNPNNAERIYIRKIVIEDVTEELYGASMLYQSVKTAYANATTIDYTKYIQYLETNNIKYVEDDDIINITPKNPKFYGDITVLRVVDKNEQDGTTYDAYKSGHSNSKLYYVDKVTCTTYDSTIKDNKFLSVGDKLVVFDKDGITTRVEITNVDTSRNFIEVNYIEGYKNIVTGTILKPDLNLDNTSILDIDISPNQYVAIFSKLIDPDSKTLGEEWSNGIWMYTNELLYKEDQSVSLSDFYKAKIVDIGKILKSNVYDSYPISYDYVLAAKSAGFISNITPVLDPNDYKVVRINKHMAGDIDKLKRDVSKKKSLEHTISDNINTAERLKTTIQTSTYKTLADKKAAENDLFELNAKIDNDRITFNTLVSAINEQANAISGNDKYHVRGFIPYFDNIQGMSVAQIVIQYRYTSTDNTIPPTDSFDTSFGVKNFSLWTEIRNYPRRRKFSQAQNKFIWEDNDEFNTISIPITRNENVQFRIKYLLDAGWPSNPQESPWSDIVTIPFSEEDGSESIADMIEDNKIDLAKTTVDNALINAGIKTHVRNSFTSGDTYYAHSTDEIASGWVSEEQVPISLYNKLKSMDEIFAKTQALYNAVDRDNFIFELADEDGNIYPLEDGCNTIELPTYQSLLQLSIGADFTAKNIKDINNGYIRKKFSLNIYAKDSASFIRFINYWYGSRADVKYEEGNSRFGLIYDKTYAADNSHKLKNNYHSQYVYIMNVPTSKITESTFICYDKSSDKIKLSNKVMNANYEGGTNVLSYIMGNSAKQLSSKDEENDFKTFFVSLIAVDDLRDIQFPCDKDQINYMDLAKGKIISIPIELHMKFFKEVDNTLDISNDIGYQSDTDFINTDSKPFVSILPLKCFIGSYIDLNDVSLDLVFKMNLK